MKRVLIIGAGIGGLVAAKALTRIGLEVAIFEQAPEIRPLGAGLSLWHNAIKMLDYVGLGEVVRAVGTPIETLQVRNQAGQVLSQVDVGAIARKLGGVHLIVHRGELQTGLVQALEPGLLTLGATCTRVEQDETGVTAHFADGRTERGDLLVGADGVRSVIRRHLHGEQPPRYAGYVAWLGVSPQEEPRLQPAVGFESWGRGTRLGMFPLKGGRVYWYALENSSTPPTGTAPGRKEEVLAFLRGWHTPAEDVVRATPDDAIVRIGIFDRPPLTRWGQGRITLLGDAAHPMTPNLGQGACQAIEDAATLAACLHADANPLTALPAYEARRLARTRSMVEQSRISGKLSQSSNPLAMQFRDWLFRLTPDALLSQRYEALFQYDLPQG